MRESWMRYCWLSLALAGAYFFSAKAGLAMPSLSPKVTLLWPPTGISIAALLRLGPRYLPALWVAGTAINYATGSAWLGASMIGVGNALGPLVAHALLTRVADFHPSMDRTRDVWALLGFGALLSMLIPCSVGVGVMVWSGLLPPEQMLGAWWRWWLGDAVGVLVVAPPLLAFQRGVWEELLAAGRRGWLWSSLGLVLCLPLLTFLHPTLSAEARAPLASLSMVAVVWAGLKWGTLVGTATSLLVAVVASVGTAWNGGPFAAVPELLLRLDLLWAYIATVSIAVLLTLALRIERERVAARLSESERRMASIVACLPGLVYRRAPGAGWRAEVLSDKARQVLGFGAADLIAGNPSFQELIVEADRERIQREVDSAVAAGRPFQIEYRIRDASGRERWCLEHGDAERDVRGNARALEGIVFDNSERKQMESALLHAQKMDAVGRLAGGIAHDFNNLLLVIIGYAELLRQGGQGAEVHHELDQITCAAQRGAALVRQLLAYGRKQVLNLKLSSLSRVVANLRGMLEPLLQASVTLEQRLAARGMVLADPAQLEQVVINLVLNGRDAMPDGGALHIETEDILLTQAVSGVAAEIPPGHYVVLRISDTGQGMSPEVQERAFEPFFTTKPVGKGTGLGLSTVYGIISQSHGFLSLDSRPGHGTTLRIYLPRADASPIEAAARPAGAASA